MLKSSRKRRAPCSRRQAPATIVEAVAAAQVLGALGGALDELEHEQRVLGQVVDDLRADAGLGRRDRVSVLVLAVDREQARVLGRHPHDVGARRR